MFSDQMSPHFSFFLGKMDVQVQRTASVMVWGCISAHGMGDPHICEGTIDAEAYVGILEYAAVKMITFPSNSMSVSAGQCQASFFTSYNSVAS